MLFAGSQAQRIGRRIKRLTQTIRTRAPTPDQVRAFWVLSVFQALMVFHAASLLVRGSQRLMEWTMLGLYAAVAVLPRARHKTKTDPMVTATGSESITDPV